MNKYKVVQEYYNRVCRLAENNMIKTGKLEGSHYAAMDIVLEEYRTEEYGSEKTPTNNDRNEICPVCCGKGNFINVSGTGTSANCAKCNGTGKLPPVS